MTITLSTLDFSNATNALQLKAVSTHSKHSTTGKVSFRVNYLNNFNSLIPITIRRYIFQAVKRYRKREQLK